LPGAVPTLVLTAAAGIDVELAVAGHAPQAVTPGLEPVRLTTSGGSLDVLVLPAETAAEAWVCEDGPARRLLLSASDLSWGPDGRVEVRGAPEVLVYDPAARAFTELALTPPAMPATASPPIGNVVQLVRPASAAVPVGYGKHDGRQSAPAAEVFDALAAVYRLELPAWAADPALDPLLRIDWAGDVAELRVDGTAVTDRFWDGSEWIVSLRDAGYRPDAELTLHLLPLATGSTVHLPRDARDRLLAADGQLHALDAVRVVGRPTWRSA